MRSVLKRALEAGFIYGGPGRLVSYVRRHQVIVLAYHNVVADDEAGFGDASLHLPVSRFRAHLEMLARGCDFVPLRAVLDSRGGSGRVRIVVTFDDAYEGTITHGLPELARLGIPATIFVSPGFLGGKTFWWDDFRFVVGSPERRHALMNLAGDDDRVREWARAQGLSPIPTPPSFRVTSEARLRAVAGGAITLGAHGWRHRNFASLSDADLREELERPRQWLEERLPGVIPWVAYPYGLSDERVQSAAAAAGYQGGLLTVGGGATVPPANPCRTPRFTVPAGLSKNGLAIRTSGRP
ncbi:MAG TPA: polysaccharide deacetylase family protein [Gemmatimonadales bacterium]|jgi:peptidoglycan/xylan/chitin deacetylase (PgdA/CDA1 family)|nr:polysaccharide deacetylase family protein [Gemmatimonadales bacterium]